MGCVPKFPKRVIQEHVQRYTALVSKESNTGAGQRSEALSEAPRLITSYPERPTAYPILAV